MSIRHEEDSEVTEQTTNPPRWDSTEVKEAPRNRPTDLGIAYILLLLGGLLGLHRHYLGRHGSAYVMTVLAVSFIGLPINLVWVIVDLFLVPSIFHKEVNRA